MRHENEREFLAEAARKGTRAKEERELLNPKPTATKVKMTIKKERAKDIRPNFPVANAQNLDGSSCELNKAGQLLQVPKNWNDSFRRLVAENFAPDTGLAQEWKALVIDLQIENLKLQQEELLFQARVERGEIGADELREIKRAKLLKELKDLDN